MACYDTGSYGEIGEYHWVPYSNASSDDVPYQASITCSDFDSYEPKSIQYYLTTYGVHPDLKFDAPKPIDYYPANYGDPCDSYYTHFDVNYSTYSFSDPKLITYEPIPCDNGYVLSETQYLISYSTTDSGFDDTGFEEYDPTPYGGGYDQTLTYGKALPPSDEICYPRSTPEPSGLPPENLSLEAIPSAHVEKRDAVGKPSGLPPENISLETIPSAHVKKRDAVDSNTPYDEKEKVDVGDPEIPLNTVDDGKQGDNDLSVIEKESDHGSDFEEPLDMKVDEEDGEGEYTYSDYGYDYPWSRYDYGNGKSVNEATPYEYNADTVDLCESIFGHWPCLARRQERLNRNEDAAIIANGKRNSNPWEGTANYLFGDPLGYGYSNYRCENYYQQKPCAVKEECYDENSWIHNLNIF